MAPDRVRDPRRPAVVEHDDGDALVRVARAAQLYLADDADLVASLTGVAAAGCALLGGCDAASVTILEGERPATVGSTSDLATDLDAAQYREGVGPCLTAAREGRIVRIDEIAREDRWPSFASAALAANVNTSLSVPLSLVNPTTFAGLNFYGHEADGFDEADLKIAQAFAGQASAVVANALAYWAAFEQATNLTQAMEHRAEIEQAKGILMATQHCSADEAFDLLRRASQRENRKLRDIAVDIVQRTAKTEPEA
jgi:GAF domain-containing protein